LPFSFVVAVEARFKSGFVRRCVRAGLGGVESFSLLPEEKI
jgi:hypothetical protein